MFTYIFHILEFPGISWNFFISRKLPGNDQDFPEFGKFPSKWKQCPCLSPYHLQNIIRRLPGRRALVVVFIKNMFFEIIAFVVFECL